MNRHIPSAPAQAGVSLLAIMVALIDVYVAGGRLGHDYDIALLTAAFGALGVTTVRVGANGNGSSTGG